MNWNIGDLQLDQPEPIDVGDLVWKHRLPWDAVVISTQLALAAQEWDGYELAVRAEGAFLICYVVAIVEPE